ITMALGTATPGQAREARHESHRSFEPHRGFAPRRDFDHHFRAGSRGFIVGPSLSFGPSFYWGAAPAPGYAYSAPSSWYSCASYGAYYPNVATCPEPWVPIPAG